jgi:D-alanyl-D-alanine dipeptidase
MLKHIVIFLVLIFQASVSIGDDAPKAELKSGFVYVSDVDPSIIENLRYCGIDNITGKPLLGYIEARAVLTREAATALSAVQEELVMHGYSLVIYDSYHPVRTYRQLKEWAENPKETGQKDSYFPHLSKQELIQKGYIEIKRDHTRGSTVDVSIIPINQKIKIPYNKKKRSYKDYKDIVYFDDGTIDMGSSYDLMDELSRHGSQVIHAEARSNRKMLKDIMENYGFASNDKVWWQYTLIREPYFDTEFDFEV